ncbi:hypothetical protein BDR07DRAFT_1378355 [Suillus spraguei]|nr:hypothetical protein BDR07DRAFT_1378355 [Suillus spraguei]
MFSAVVTINFKPAPHLASAYQVTTGICPVLDGTPTPVLPMGPAIGSGYLYLHLPYRPIQVSRDRCLLLAENLRCAPLNLIEIHALTLLPAIELFFCVYLIYMTSRSKRAHLLLAADGVLYFILALVDLLLHVLPAVQNSVTISRVAELFLVWLSRREFIPCLPRRSQRAAKYLFTGLIPVVAVSNLVASLGMSIRERFSSFMFLTNVSSEILSFPRAPLVIDLTSKSESLWLSLGQLSLILYTNYQCLTAFLALYRLFTALFNQWRIDADNADERHFFNGTAWITFGIKLGAAECIVGSVAGGFSVPLFRRILRLAVSGLSRKSSLDEKGVKRGKVRDVTVHAEVDKLPVLHIRPSAPRLPEQAIHADESRKQSGWNTSAEGLASSNDASPLKDNAQHQPAPTTSDDMKVMLELISDFAPSVTGECPETTPSQKHEDDESKLPNLNQQNTHRNAAQSYDEENAAAAHTVFCASEFVEHKPTLPPITVPQAAHAQEETLSSCGRLALQHRSGCSAQFPVTPTWARKHVSSCTGLVSQHRSLKYPVQFPVTPARARFTTNSLAGQLKGEKWDSLIGRHTQLLSRQLLDRAGRTCGNITAHSSLWSQQSASVSMHAKVNGPLRIPAYPGDLVSPSIAETLRDGIIHQELIPSVDAVIREFDAESNRDKALRRLNGETDV